MNLETIPIVGSTLCLFGLTLLYYRSSFEALFVKGLDKLSLDVEESIRKRFYSINLKLMLTIIDLFLIIIGIAVLMGINYDIIWGCIILITGLFVLLFPRTIAQFQSALYLTFYGCQTPAIIWQIFLLFAGIFAVIYGLFSFLSGTNIVY